ncbi:phage major capsid protein [Mycolicibacterium komossense]|uniref:Phage major capsid protein n=1 Tax=Mycolicibacterium komossense TaxID=1779 RepID=A0ABT3C8P0_9MYCO|nr:phage major capsid protein [Mycolicibacterium komossense]MCV7225852.1 phage major capsid protein [Mycolicibacterium komossense]
MTIEQILAKLQEISALGETRSLTDEEVTSYEELEGQLKAAQKTAELRSRTAAYVAPNASLQAGVHVATAKGDDGLDVAFRSYLRTGQSNSDMTELRALGSGDSAGGYLIPPGFRDKLVEVQKAFGGLLNEVEQLPTQNGATIEYPSNDDTANQGAITAESAVFGGGDDLAYGTVSLPTYKFTSAGTGSLPLRVPVELIQDAFFPIEAHIAKKLGTRIMRKMAAEAAVGSGSSEIFGICHAGLTEDKALTTTTTITYADLLDLEAKLDPSYEQNAKWVFNKATWTAIRKLEDDNGRPLIFDQAASGIAGAPQKTLLGYPVVLDQTFPNGIGDSANFAVLGDLREAYVWRSVEQLAVVVNPYTRANNGEVEFTAWQRAGGAIQNRKAYTVLATQDV